MSPYAVATDVLMGTFSGSQGDDEGAPVDKGEDGAETEEWEVEDM